MPESAFRFSKEKVVKGKVRSKLRGRWDGPTVCNLKGGREISSREKCSLELSFLDMLV